jgi:PAS domain S-box-containing protein
VNTATPSVLIIASYERSQTSTRSQEDAIRAEIERAYPFAHIRSDYIVSAMATEQAPSEELLSSFANTLRVQHKNSKVDLVVAIDTIAFRVLSGPGRDILQDAPLIFTGLSLDRQDVDRLGLNATGVYERIDPAGTVELALKLQPETRRILVVASGSTRSEGLGATAARLLEPMKSRVDIRWSKSTTTEELFKESGEQGPGTAVLYLAFTDVSSGLWDARGLKLKWPVPAYSVFGSNLRLGMIGGRVVDPAAQGNLAGAMAVRVLGGEAARTIDPCVGCTNAIVVREPMLRAWGIPKSRVPADAKVWEPMPGWLEEHRSMLVWMLIAVVLESGIIALLLVNLGRRRRAEAALTAQRERYELAIQGSHDGIWDWNVLTGQIYWSARLQELLGLGPREFQPNIVTWAERLHPDDAARTQDALKAHLERSEPYDVEYRLRLKDGSYRWFRARGTAVRDASGAPVRMAGSLRDTHERREATERLQENEQRYRQTFHTNQAMKLVVDPADGRIVDANEAASAFYGYPLDRLLKMSVFDINAQPRDEVSGLIAEAAANRAYFQTRHRLASGAIRDVEVYTGPFRFQGRQLLFSIVHNITDAQRARTALLESEAKYRRIVETAAEGIWMVDTTWHTTFVNPSMAAMLGYSADEMMGRHLFDFMDDRARTECERNMQRREQGIAEQHEFRFRHKDGHDVWTTIVTNPMVGNDGEFVGALAMLTDITQRRTAEAAARAAETMFRSTFEHAAVGMSNVDLQGRWLMMNDRMCEILGRDRATLMKMTFSDVTHPDDVAENVRLLKKAVAGDGDTYTMEKRYIRPDGSIVWAYVTATLVRDASGQPQHFISVIQDISDRKRAEAELRESRRLLEQAQTVGRIGSWSFNPNDENSLRWSDEVFRIFGADPAKFNGRTDIFYRSVHPDDLAAVAEAHRAALAGEREYSVDHRILRPDGTIRWVHEQAEIERDPEGRPIRMIGVVQDITDRAEAQRFGERQRAVLELMAAGASLETTIRAIVDLVERERPTLGSVLRLDEKGRMWTMSAPGLPPSFTAMVNGLVIGPGVGSCGTAMADNRRVIVANIATDPLWAQFKDAALPHGLRACWSEPIRASDGSVLGSLAMYFREARRPTENDLAIITTAAHLAGIAMERARSEEARSQSEAAYRALLEAIPDMMFRIDRSGVYLDFHAPDASRLMVPPEQFMGRTVREVMPRDRADQCMDAIEALFKTGLSQTYEYAVRRADGSSAWWEVRVVRARQAEVLLLLRDVSERREAERRQRDSEQRLRLLVESTPLGVISWNLDFTVAGWNPGAERLFGYTEAEAMGQHASFIIPESARGGVDAVWRELLANRGGFRAINQNVRSSGELVYCDWYNAPLVDATGRVIGVASLVEDVTERRLAQQRTDFMMAELDHRVKNNLAAVISLAEQTGRGSSEYREFLDTFMGRLRAMARMHSVLARSRWQGADLHTLVTQTLEAFGSGSFGRASVEGPSAMLNPKTAQAIAMALNELATNAVKYGALSAAGGHVKVEWTIESAPSGPRRLKLRWQERGGPAVSPPSRRGFGTELIEGAIAYELRGTAAMSFEPEGVVCRVDVPFVSELEEQAQDEQGGPKMGIRLSTIDTTPQI